MGNRRPLAPQEFYHLYNRGTEKRNIFDTQNDYERFIGLLYLSNSTERVHINNHRGSTLMQWLTLDRGTPLVDIAAYCLMPNHFHILVLQREDGGISRFMQKLTTAYTMYFNIKNKRVGALFQSKFKSKHGAEDRYVKYLLSYIHLNPIKLIEPKWKELGLKHHKRAGTHLDTYPYSSYLDYVGKERLEGRIINKEILPYFDSPKEFKKEVFEWLSYNDGECIKVEP